MSELRRGTIRIVSNYIRLGSTLAIGITLAPILLSWLGNDGFGIVQLIVMSVGLPSVILDIMRQSMIRPLGRAFHADDPELFTRVYMSSYLVSAAAAVLATVGFLVLMFAVPYLRIPQELQFAAQIMVAVEGVYIASTILTEPVGNMLVVSERFILQNVLLVTFRICTLASAVLWIVAGTMDDVESKLIALALFASFCKIFIHGCAVFWLIATTPYLRLRPSRISRREAYSVMRTTGGVALVTLSVNVQTFVSAFIMNMGFGLLGNVVYGLARQLASYVRMTTVGMSFGLDAVSTRISTTRSSDSLRDLAHYTTRLHALIALPAGVFVLLFAEPLLTIWIGRQLEDPQTNLPYAIALTRILAFGLTATGIGEGWIRLLYGAGFLRQYMMPLLGAGVANPVLAITLYYILPEPIRYQCAALAYSTVFVIVYLVIMPRFMIKLIGISLADLVQSIARPSLCAAIAGGGAWSISSIYQIDSWYSLLGLIALFGAAYALFSWWITLTLQERQKIIARIRHRIKPLPTAAAMDGQLRTQQEAPDDLNQPSDGL